MENLSEALEMIAIPLVIPVPVYLCDHHVGDRVVLPAVEALQILARSKPAVWNADLRRQEQAVFRHPLMIDSGTAEIHSVHEHARYADGRCLSRLTTLLSGRQMKFTRRMEHLSVWFTPADLEVAGCRTECKTWCEAGDGAGNETDPLPDPVGVRSGPSGAGGDFGLEVNFPPDSDDPTPAPGPKFRVSADRLYNELVPFGPAYRNVRGNLLLSETCVSATVSGGDFPEAVGLLGSPFPLDAAMHAACAWGQRYRNRVVFPIGFDRREILAPTRAGKIYSCRVTPLPDEGSVLRFDVRLRGPDRRPVEVIRGLAMKDIFAGRLVPPAWVREGV
jgi:hypothetical protein